jgi:hypothetical protein
MPRIKTNRTVRVALWALRIYLLVLLALIGLKFVRMSSSFGDKGRGAANPASSSAPKPVP